MLLNVKELYHPKLYVRMKIKDVNIKDLLDIAKNNKDEKKQLVWPFPAIEVVKNGKAYEILDGNRRTMVAKALKVEAIPAKILEIKDPGERYLYQIKANLHGMMLDKDQRDNAIRLLAVQFKMKPEDLTKEFKLTKASISRILNKKQRKTEPRKRPTENREGEGDFSPTNLMERSFYIAEEFSVHGRDMKEFLNKLENPNKDNLTKLAQNLAGFVLVIQTYLRLEKNGNSGKTT